MKDCTQKFILEKTTRSFNFRVVFWPFANYLHGWNEHGDFRLEVLHDQDTKDWQFSKV